MYYLKSRSWTNRDLARIEATQRLGFTIGRGLLFVAAVIVFKVTQHALTSL